MGKYSGTSSLQHRGFEFAEFALDLDRAALLRNGIDQRLRPQVFDVLLYLVERSGCLVGKEELLQNIWGGKAVTDDSLTHCIIEIRKALDDSERRMIRTVPCRGFVFDEVVVKIECPPGVSVRGPRTSTRTSIGAVAVIATVAAFMLAAAHRSTTDDIATTSELPGYYEQARFLFHRRAPGDVEAARDYYLDAIELDPGSAKAWAGLAGTYHILSYSDGEQREELLGELKFAAEAAIRLAPHSAEGWMRLAHYYYATEDTPAAERAVATALEVGPNDPLVLSSLAGRLAHDGDLEAAIRAQQRAVELEPLSFVDRGNLSHYLFAAGRFEEAMLESERAYQMRPAAADDLNTLIGFSLVMQGSYEKALDVVEGWPDGPDKFAALAMAGYALGRDDEAAKSVGKLMVESGREASMRMAELQAYCKNINKSLSRLTQLRTDLIATADRGELRTWVNEIHLSPFLATVRDDPRWSDWIRQTRELVLASNTMARQR